MKLNMFVDAMQAIENDRKLTKEIVVSALEEALIKAYRKHIEIPDALVRVDIDESSGAIKVYQEREVVEEVEDDEMEISLKDAQAISKNYQLGDLVDEEVNIQEFGRAAVILAKNVMKQKIREAEKQIVYEEYCDKVDEMIYGTIETVEEKFCIVNIGKTLAMMPKNQQMPNERYREGERIRVVIIEVNKETKGAQVLVSRADPTLVKRLFEKEVPEIYQGIIEIKAIAREAGERTKMAVYSHNENIDPIGACIGPRGQRVQVIIDELHGEKIDIFEWSEDVSELIKNALSPAEVLVIKDLRRAGGAKALGKANDLKAMIKALQRGEVIAVPIDQDAKEAGVVSPFLGSPASTPLGPAKLAAKLGCDVIPGICTRNPDGVTFSMKFYPPMKGRDGEPFGKNIQTSTDDLNAVISEGIKAHPEQWMWMYPRWESVERGIFNDRGN